MAARVSGLGLALVLAVATAACGDEDARTAAPTPSASMTAQPTSPAPSPTPTVTPEPTAPTSETTSPTAEPTSSEPAPSTSTTPTSRPSPRTSLRVGDRGEAVRTLQERLSALGYWLGPVDGVFGNSTLHAVIALQKVAGLSRDGVVGPATRRALDAGVRPDARSSSGRVVEIDLPRQVLLVVANGEVQLVFDTSTGAQPGTTPRGHWEITREIDGLRRSELGLLYRPKYFYGGVAIHGYTSVPPYPASHGCVRVTYPAMDHIWATGLMPIGRPVWVY